jgi:hypothetical protein
VASYSSAVPSKHNTSVRGFGFKGTGVGVEEDGSVVIAEEPGQQRQRTAVGIYVGNERLHIL